MQIKKFKANSFAAAMDQVKAELGEQALILNTRSIQPTRKSERKPGRQDVEITAAIDHSTEEVLEVQKETVSRTIENSLDDEFWDLDFKSLMMTLLSQTDRARALGLKGHQLNLYKELIEGGVNERMAVKMFEKINSDKELKNKGPVSDKLIIENLMKRAVLCDGPIKTQKGYPKVIALVGPTGVGKTTTLAKLAAYYAIKQSKRVALISLDTYRIGAVDQLRVYGEIMRIPVDNASDDRQYRKLLHKHSDKDFIFVDTTGKSYKDCSHARTLHKILRLSGPAEVHLTLSIALQERIMEEAYNQFAPLKVDKVVFTKIDEGLSFGSLFNFSLKTRLPFSYFTTGQRVPEDIELAKKDTVIRLIFNSIRAKVGN